MSPRSQLPSLRQLPRYCRVPIGSQLEFKHGPKKARRRRVPRLPWKTCFGGSNQSREQGGTVQYSTTPGSSPRLRSFILRKRPSRRSQTLSGQESTPRGTTTAPPEAPQFYPAGNCTPSHSKHNSAFLLPGAPAGSIPCRLTGEAPHFFSD